MFEKCRVFLWFLLVFGGLNLNFEELRGANWKDFALDGVGNKRAIFLGLVFSSVGFWAYIKLWDCEIFQNSWRRIDVIEH